MLKSRYAKLFLGVFLFICLGLAMQKVMGFGLSSGGKSVLQAEKGLLLTNEDGVLSEKDSIKILKNLDKLIAKIHSVRRDEWMEKIARDLGIPAIAIRSTNDLEDPLLRPNQQILIQNKKGMVHVAKEGETFDAMVKAYEKLGSGRNKILAANELGEMTYLKDGTICLIEGTKWWIPDARRSYPFLSKPVFWSRISSSFGLRRHPLLKIRRQHDGYDLVAPYGSPVYAGQDGTVVFAGVEGGYGNVIDVRHTKIMTRYGHLSKIYVNVGDKVKRKQIIGRVGSTGISTGPHLHFEVRRNSDGRPVRPGKYLY